MRILPDLGRHSDCRGPLRAHQIAFLFEREKCVQDRGCRSESLSATGYSGLGGRRCACGRRGAGRRRCPQTVSAATPQRRCAVRSRARSAPVSSSGSCEFARGTCEFALCVRYRTYKARSCAYAVCGPQPIAKPHPRRHKVRFRDPDNERPPEELAARRAAGCRVAALAAAARTGRHAAGPGAVRVGRAR